jgi:hypothetical protein
MEIVKKNCKQYHIRGYTPPVIIALAALAILV